MNRSENTMALTLELTPAIQAQLEARASKSGMSVERVVLLLLEKSLGRPVGQTAVATDADYEQWLRDLDELVAIGEEVEASNISDEAFRRENMYEDRGL